MNIRSQLAQYREQLTRELVRVRRTALDASERGDFRTVGRLTVEAARLNRAISETQAKEQAALGTN